MNRDHTRSLQVGLLLCAAVSLPACGDAPTHPDALLVTPETAPALRLDPALPTLPRIIDDVAGSPDGAPGTVDREMLERAERLWLRAGGARNGESNALRDSAYALAAPRLAAAVDSAALASYRERLGYWIEAGSRAVPRRGGTGIAEALADARVLLARTDSLWARGDAAGSVDALLRASDRLVDVTPRGVARRLVRMAEAARSAWPDDARDGEGERGVAFRRAARLLDGAREALAEADHVRAIQRAYYAARLLEGR